MISDLTISRFSSIFINWVKRTVIRECIKYDATFWMYLTDQVGKNFHGILTEWRNDKIKTQLRKGLNVPWILKCCVNYFDHFKVNTNNIRLRWNKSSEAEPSILYKSTKRTFKGSITEKVFHASNNLSVSSTNYEGAD